MNGASSFRWPLVLLFLFLLLPPGPVGTDRHAAAAQSYPASSWAIGIVVPEGAGLEGGGRLNWEDLSNVTALLILPNITRPDLPVYSVLSLMTADGSVLQVAVGVYRDSPHWAVYADLVTNVKSVPPNYQQILNSSGQPLPPNAPVAISIFRSPSGPWNLRVVDVVLGSSVEQAFPSGIAPSLKAGDQELFAVESYSRSQKTFQSMGNLTLRAILADGKRITDGFYSYSDWDPSHHPLFVVGSAGSSPPIFVSLRGGVDGSFLWSFENQWPGSESSSTGVGEWLLVSLLLLGSVLAIALAITRSQRSFVRRRQSGQ